MKHLVTLCLTLFFSYVSNAQPQWETIHMNDNISFTFPTGYKQNDTLGQNNFHASARFGILQAAQIQQPHAKIENKDQLIDYYLAFEKSTLEQNSGSNLSSQTIRIGHLFARKFEFETSWNDSLEVQETMIIMIGGSIYSFTYAYFKSNSVSAIKERDAFFDGITIHNTDFEDQLTIPNSMERSGEFFGIIFRYTTIAAAVLAIAFWFLKKYSYLRILKNIFSVIFLAWGSICVFIFAGNLFFGKVMHPILIAGAVCLIVGLILRKIKIPSQRKTEQNT